MKNIRKYNDFKINENLENIEFNKYSSVKGELIELISDSVNSENVDLIKEFISSFMEDPTTTQIEGLINDSDIYDFYLKFTTDIDEILNENDFFEKVPIEDGVLGLYDYIVYGTSVAVNYLVEEINEEL